MNHVESFCLDQNYSTTRLVFRENPIVREDHNGKPERSLFLPLTEGRKGEGGLRTQGYFKSDFPQKPLITIVTVVFNGEAHLEQAILSVINQSYDNVEYIIIDGGSSDSTVDVIMKYECVIDYWVSEPDGGIYDAMNKGVSLEIGSYVLFLGADDRLTNEQVLSIMSGYAIVERPTILFGSVIYNYDINPLEKRGKNKIVTSRLDWMIFLHNTVHHQSCFYHKSLFSDWRYDSSLRLIADYELNLLIFKRGFRACPMSLVVSSCCPYGASRSNFFLSKKETNIVRSRHISNFILSFIAFVLFEFKSVVSLMKIFLTQSMSKKGSTP